MKDIDETMQSLLDTQKREKRKEKERITGLLGHAEGKIVNIIDEVIKDINKK